jgi:hypothetical protein
MTKALTVFSAFLVSAGIASASPASSVLTIEHAQTGCHVWRDGQPARHVDDRDAEARAIASDLRQGSRVAFERACALAPAPPRDLFGAQRTERRKQWQASASI